MLIWTPIPASRQWPMACNRPLPDPVKAPERIVDGRVFRIQADGHRPDPRVPEFSRGIMVDEVPAGAHDHPESLLRAVPGNIVDVLTEQRFAAAQHNNRPPGCPDLVDDPECLCRGEHSGCLLFARIHVTVGTLQGAPEGDVPRDDTRCAHCTVQCFSPCARSKRSRFITLVQAATKSCRNFSCESALP